MNGDPDDVRMRVGYTISIILFVSRIVTIIEGVQVIEVTTHDSQGDPLETHYVVRGEKYETLKQAMRAARGED